MSKRGKVNKGGKEKEEEEYRPEPVPVIAGDEEEIQYNPDDVFENDDEEDEEEEQQIFDVNRLSKEEKKIIETNNNKVLFLKALSRNCYQDVTKLANKCGIFHRSQADGIITTMMGAISETSNDANFPNRVLKMFNGLVPEGYPNKVYLEREHINELTNLFLVITDKIQSTAHIADPDKIFGDGPITDAKTINHQEENIVVMDSSQANGPNQEPTNAARNVIQTPNQPYERVMTGSRIPQYEQNYQQQVPAMEDIQKNIEFFAAKYPAPDIGLMEMALKRIPNPRPGSIAPFISSFVDLYTDWMANPMKMLEELKFFFGPTHGEHAYRLWKDYREKYMKFIGYAPLPSTSMSTGEYSPYQFGGQFGGYGSANNGGQSMGMLGMGGFNPVYNQEMESDRLWNRKMDKMMKMIEMRLMADTMDSQQQSPAAMMYGQNYEEILNPDTGKVIKRVFLGGGSGMGMMGGGAGTNPAELTLVSTLSGIFQEMLRGANSEKVELMKKLNTPDTVMSGFTNTLMSNFINQQNPVAQIKELMEISKMVQSNNPQASSAEKSIEAIKLDVDSRIALQQIELKKLEMQHNWRMDERQQSEQDSNVDKWLNVMMQMGEGIIKPVALKFVEGIGQGGKIPGLGGLFGGGAGAAAANNNGQQAAQAQMEQMQAMQQQQQYNPYAQQQQQQQPSMYQPQQPMQQPQQYMRPPMREPPLNPLPPQGNMYRPVQQLSEQDIQQELSRYSPNQLQEMEDKMVLNTVNQEKILNAIRAQKNARRFRQPVPQQSSQQQEAQQILNPQQQQEQEQEEDDFDLNREDFEEQEEEEEDDSNFVPIARGSPPPAARPETVHKKFSSYAQDSTTDIIRKKRLTNKQKAMLAEGQLSPKELEDAPDSDEDNDDDDDGYSTVPVAGSPSDASREAMIEENLKRLGIKRQGSDNPPEPKQAQETKKSKKVTKKEKKSDEIVEKEPQQPAQVIDDVESLLDEAELIDSDDV